MKYTILVVSMQTRIESAGLKPGTIFAGLAAYKALEQEFKGCQVMQVAGLKRPEDCLTEFNKPVGTMYIRCSRVVLAPDASEHSVYVGVEA